MNTLLFNWGFGEGGVRRNADRVALSVLLTFTVVVVLLAFTRDFMTYGTETDFLGGFVPEAKRLLKGEALKLEYHPPLYSMVIAMVWTVIRDWFSTGLIVSILSGISLMAISFLIFRRVSNVAGAFGAMFGLLASPIFVSYSALATSDVFFTSLYWAGFLLTVRALDAESRKSWFWCGAVLGLILLTRTNGVAALVLVVAPWFVRPRAAREWGYDVGAIVLGLVLVLAVWVVIVLLTDSRFTPALTHGGLAQTYFVGPHERYVGTIRLVLEERFHSVWEVITYDPVRMAKTYVRDLLILSRRIFYHDQLLAFPFSHLALPGLLVLLLRKMNAALLLIVVGAVLHILLLNFKAFESRFYLFLVPLFGAATGVLVETMYGLAKGRKTRAVAIAAIGLLAAAGVGEATINAFSQLHKQDELLADIVKQASRAVPKGATVVTLRPQVAYYLNAEFVLFPPAENLEGLRQALNVVKARGRVFVYVGRDETRERLPSIANWKGMTAVPPWLAPVAAGTMPQEWVLYEFLPMSAKPR